jgi:hypothetical protein
MAEQEIVIIGALPNDGQGDPLRVAFGKINNNFANLFSTSISTETVYTVGNVANQVIFETTANTFTMGNFQIKSADPGTVDQQNIELFSQISSNLADIKWTGSGGTLFGSVLGQYDMDVDSGNVRILFSPDTSNVTSQSVSHFITSQISFAGAGVEGIAIELDGYVANSIMSTEDNVEITTEETP